MKNNKKYLALLGAGALLTSTFVATNALTANSASAVVEASKFPEPDAFIDNIPDNQPCPGGRWVKFEATGGKFAGSLEAKSGQPKMTIKYDNYLLSNGDQTFRFYELRFKGSTTNLAFNSVAGGIADKNPVWTFPDTNDTKLLAKSPLLLKNYDKNFSQFSICAVVPLSVSKTAIATYTNQYSWELTKTVDQKSISLAQGKTGTANYTVVATRTGPVKTGIVVSGTVTLTNSGKSPVIVTGVKDTMSGQEVPLECPRNDEAMALSDAPSSISFTLWGDSKLECSYSVKVTGNIVPETNSVTFTTRQNESVTNISAEVEVVDGDVESIDEPAIVTDAFNNGSSLELGTISVSTPFKYSHSFTCGGVKAEGSELIADGATKNFPNTAELTSGTGSPLKASADVAVTCAKPESTTTTTKKPDDTTTTTKKPDDTTTTTKKPEAPNTVPARLVPDATTTTAAATTTTATPRPAPAAAIPAQVLAGEVNPPTLKAEVEGVQITKVSPAYTGSDNGLIGAIGAMLLALGGVFLLASKRRRKSA